MGFFKKRKKGSASESPAYRQMVNDPSYWQYMFAYAYAAYEERPRGHDGAESELTPEEKVVYLSAVTAVLDVIYKKTLFKGDERMDSARDKLAFTGGWVAQDPAALNAIPKEANRQSFDLTYTHPADSTAKARLWADFDGGMPGMDNFGAEIYLGPKYQSEIMWLIQSDHITEFLSGEMRDVRANAANLEYGQMWSDRSGPGRDGWANTISLEIKRLTTAKGASESSAPATIYLSAKRQERLL